MYVFLQAELLQQEIINRQRMSAAVQRLVEDLPHQAQAAEDRSFAAFLSLLSAGRQPRQA